MTKTYSKYLAIDHFSNYPDIRTVVIQSLENGSQLHFKEYIHNPKFSRNHIKRINNPEYRPPVLLLVRTGHGYEVIEYREVKDGKRN